MPVAPVEYVNALHQIDIAGRLRDGENIDINIQSRSLAYKEQRVLRWATTVVNPTWQWSTIDKVDNYVAISHTWGPDDSLFPAVFAGVTVQVSRWKLDNLQSWIKSNLPNIWIWMDIFCVPQGSGEVIVACLQSIPHIYYRASCVHVLLEDQAQLPTLPTYEEFRLDDIGGQTRLPPKPLIEEWMAGKKLSLPNPAWLQRLWTRQEAQYATQISFHGVGMSEEGLEVGPLQVQAGKKALGQMIQLSASMMDDQWSVGCKLLIEMVAARGTPISGLPGWPRQQKGGLVMALRELRAARRSTAKSQDYVLALFPTFPWYIVPPMPRHKSTFALLNDAIQQFECSRDCAILRPTMNGAYLSVRCENEQNNVYENSENSFDFFCTFTTIVHWGRRAAIAGGVGVNQDGSAEVVDWNVEADQEAWNQILSTVCVEQTSTYNSLERHCAFEALEAQPDMADEQRAALREFVERRNANPLAALEERRKVTEWLTCIHLILSRQELHRATKNGARLVLARIAKTRRTYPALVSTKAQNRQTMSIYAAPTIDLPDAGIAFLGFEEGDGGCHIVGSLGGYLPEPLSVRTEPHVFTSNARDFWCFSNPQV